MSRLFRTFLIAATLLIGTLSAGCDNTNNAALLLAQQPDPIAWSSPGSVTSYDPAKAWQGITLLQDQSQSRLFAIAMNGNIVDVCTTWSDGSREIRRCLRPRPSGVADATASGGTSSTARC